MPTLRFTTDDVQRFARWSHDVNPLHVDAAFARRSYFGQSIVHGMLSVGAALAGRSGPPVTSIDVEFRGAVVCDHDYPLAIDPSADGDRLTLGGDQPSLVLRLGRGDALTQPAAVPPWVREATAEPRASAAERTLEDLASPIEVLGRYPIGATPQDLGGGRLTPIQVKTLALCSYVVGMEAPGLRSLFTRARVTFAGGEAADTGSLRFRLTVDRCDAAFRMLATSLEVVTDEGTLVARADLRSYVRLSPLGVPVDALRRRLPQRTGLVGKVALVTGGTRGLGGDIAAALALAGATVIATYRTDRESAEEFGALMEAAGTNVRCVQVDAASDEGCRALAADLRLAHGGVDCLVLNACAPPPVLRVGASSAEAQQAYMRDNLALVQYPLAATLEALALRHGTVVGISSSFVDEAPEGLAHYVALKQATESLLRSVAAEQPAIDVLLTRPPRLQTSWNDTPTAVLGTIPADYVASHLVNDLLDGEVRRGVRVRREFPAPADTASTASDEAPDYTVSIASSYTADLVDDGLRFWFRELGIAGQTLHAPYGQVMQALLDPSSVFNTNRRGINAILLRAGDWLRELPPADAESPEFVGTFLAQSRYDLERALKAHRAQASVDTLLLLTPEPRDLAPAIASLVESALRDLVQGVTGVPGLHVCDAAAWHASYAVDPDVVADPVRDHLAHIPYRTPYFHTLATLVARTVHATHAAPKKVIVVDCDNTLWQGVVGELGPQGLVFDESHRALHAALNRLVASGMLLCLCSKNEEPDVWRAFDERPDLGVPRAAVVAAAINWLPKSENIRALAARLNLGLDSVVFLDDNPVECAEVRAGCPEVLTLQWPTDPAAALRLLAHTWEFDRSAGTREDARRTQMYQEEFERQGLQAQLAFADFIQHLDLHVDLAAPTPDDVKRASQMTLRTNQFNFTTIRRDESEMAALVREGRHDVLMARVRDRFGDYGIVGLLIAEPSGTSLRLDTFLLSCRVLGRGVEHRIAVELGRLAERHGCDRIDVSLMPTARNTPARIFLDAIAPPGRVTTAANGTVECRFEPTELIGVRFDPADRAVLELAEHAAADARPKPSSSRVDAGRLREREHQIGRAASEWATQAGLTAAIAGPPPGTDAARDAIDASGVDEAVFLAFASALGLPVDEVERVDELEALGCDSFKIVEITVALLEQFPSLPTTLLFEHRTVSDIAKAIVDMSAAAGASPTVTDRPRHVPRADNEAIAVVGMDVRCAGANSVPAFWDLLRRGDSAVVPVAPARPGFLHELHDARPHFAGLIDDPGGFEPEVFGVSPREAELMDPQLRLILEVTWGALEDAGALGTALEVDTGVFVGAMYSDYAVRANLVAKAGESPYKSWEHFSLANRMSAVFGFRGPSLALDTACSSSGTALHLARRALLAGDCRVAVVAGVNLILDPDRFVQLGRLGILSLQGRCLAFGADADGTILGEGAGVVVLRLLSDALSRGDRILGVIKGTGVSTGSGTVGFTAPNPTAQAVAIRRALNEAGVDPRSVTYVETHGTGTALGDPIEVRGLNLAYGDPALVKPQLDGTGVCTIGSVKPNIGHLEAAAAMVGLVKVLLQLQHGVRVPSLTSATPNPQIPFAQGPFQIQRVLGPWTRPEFVANGVRVTEPRRAGLSSFGVGGANAHVVIEEPPATSTVATTRHRRPCAVLALSGRNDAGRTARARELAEFINANPGVELDDLCHSVNVGRHHFDRRVGLVVESADAAYRDLKAIGAGAPPPTSHLTSPQRSARVTAWLFTGQGSQFVGMGRALYEAEPVFRRAIDACAARLDQDLPRPLLSVIFAAPGSAEGELLDQTGYTQPALFSLAYAYAQLWQSFGLRPAAVLGHSVGEVAALTVAGGLSLEDGLTLIAARGRLMQQLPAGGAMLSIMADEARARQAIAGREADVSVAALNGPNQVVVSGDGRVIATIQAELTRDGVRSKALQVSHAFHSPLMRPMVDAFLDVVRSLRFAPTTVPFVSGVEGRVVEEAYRTPEYWASQVLAPVLFTQAVAELDRLQATAFLEVGPQPILTGMAKSCLGATASERVWAASSRKDVHAWAPVADAAAALYAAGANLDWNAFDAAIPTTRISVPRYPFQRRPFWIEGTASLPAALASGAASAMPGLATYVERWIEAPSADAPPPPVTGHWFVLADAGPLADEVVRAVRAAGATGATVVAPPAAGLATLEAAIGAHDDVGGIVHAWALSSRLTDPTAAARLLVESTALVVRLIGGRPSRPRVWFVTSGTVVTPADPVGSRGLSLQGMAWGLARSLSLEVSEVFGAIIDLDPQGAPAEAAGKLVQEIRLASEDDQVAVRSGMRYVPRLHPEPLPAGAEPLAIRADVTYLVTGATGAIGQKLSRWLVDQGARSLVLVARRPPSADSTEAAEGMRARGVTVTHVTADLASEAGVSALLGRVDALEAPLAGIFHAAGADQPMPLVDLTPEAVATVVGAKSGGAWWLDTLTRDRDLDCFVLFSSMSAVLGSSGRAHYAAANAVLDAIAIDRRAAGKAALSVQWGPWAGGGMASSAQLDDYRRLGNHAIEPAAAFDTLARLAPLSGAVRLAVAIDWEAFLRAYEARRRRPIVRDLAAGVSTASPTHEDGAPWLARLAATAEGARPGTLRDLLRDEVAGILRLESPADITGSASFFDLGMDSLSAAELATRLERALGLRTSALVFDHPNLDALAEHMWPLVALALASAPSIVQSPAAQPVVPSPPPPSPASLPVADRQVTGYEDGVEDEIVAFQRLAWPRRREDWLRPRWTWMFRDSATRLARAPQVWLYRDQGRIVAHNGAIPVDLKVGEQYLPTAWLVDTMVLEAYRSQAVGSRLMVQAHEDLPFALSLGQTDQMRQILLRLGWRQVAPQRIAQALVRPERVFEGKVPAGAAQALGFGLRTSMAVRDAFRRRPAGTVHALDRFTERHDALWTSAARDLTCAVRRDASYLNWKYVDQPGQDFLRLEYLEGGQLRGVAVWMFREPDAAYRYTRGFLVDLVVPLNDARLVADFVHAVKDPAAQRGADALLCHHIDARLTAALTTNGFRLRDPMRYFLVRPEGAGAAQRALLTDPDAWFVTQGDSDIDRPW